MRTYFVYIMSSISRVLYTGVTSDLRGRVYQHKSGVFGGFTKKYNVTRLVYFEAWPDVRAAIVREKVLKRWTRRRKYRLIEHHNPDWRDLSVGWFCEETIESSSLR